MVLLLVDAPFATARTTETAAPAAAVPAPEADTLAASSESAAPTTGSYAFLATDGDRPIRYDPCTPVHYVVNLSQAPPNALDHIAGAIAQVQAATGINFVYDGETDEIPAAHRGLTKNPKYKGWPPVLVAWVRP